jgi:hypothetical protein
MRRRDLVRPGAARRAAAYDRADLLLVLAIDVSYSIDPADARLQMEGYAAALQDPRVLDAIASGIYGAIGLAAMGWAGQGFQRVMVPWTWVTERGDAKAFGTQLARAWPGVAERALAEAFPSSPATCISGGIDAARALFDSAPWDSWRRVIDVSGDGPNNEGPPPEPARDRAVAQGITINGLAIEGDIDVPLVLGPGATLAGYYRDSVIGGRGAFVVAAQAIGDFGAAIRRKLVLEIAGRRPGSGTA